MCFDTEGLSDETKLKGVARQARRLQRMLLLEGMVVISREGGETAGLTCELDWMMYASVYEYWS